MHDYPILPAVCTRMRLRVAAAERNLGIYGFSVRAARLSPRDKEESNRGHCKVYINPSATNVDVLAGPNVYAWNDEFLESGKRWRNVVSLCSSIVFDTFATVEDL